MGLDIVELIMTFEKKFKVDIPNIEAEKMVTVEDAANGFLKFINLEKPEHNIFERVFDKLNSTMKELHWLESDIHPDLFLKEFVPKENLNERWAELEQKLEMKIPKLNASDFGAAPKPKKILGITFYSRPAPVLDSSVSRLIDCICALNHESLINENHLTSKYEILIIILGITSKQCGIHINEIYPHSKFTSDLGLD